MRNGSLRRPLGGDFQRRPPFTAGAAVFTTSRAPPAVVPSQERRLRPNASKSRRDPSRRRTEKLGGHTMERNKGAIIRLVDDYLKRQGLSEPRGGGPAASIKAESHRALRDEDRKSTR